jgi:hypothetical protein
VVVRVQPSTLSPHADRTALEAGADAFSASVGLRPIGSAWAELTAAEAPAALASLLWKDLAYGSELMPHAEATRLATAFLALFAAPRRYLTNFPTVAAALTERLTARVVSHSWVPVTEATFDAVVLVVATGPIGLVCVADED